MFHLEWSLLALVRFILKRFVNLTNLIKSFLKALKIHVSEATKEILDTFGTFRLELRGEIDLKGKGIVTTYFLVGCTEPDPRFFSLKFIQFLIRILIKMFYSRPPTPMKFPDDNEVQFPILFPAIITK